MPRPVGDPAFRSLLGVKRFADTLGDCLHDVGHEEAGQQVSHYWDDDSLYLPIRGVLAFDDNSKQETSDRLTQSLFSAGFLGPVRLLGAHRSELLGQISKWSHREPPKASLDSQVDQFLAREPARKVMQVLGDIDTLTKESAALPDEKISEIIKQLASLEADSFSIIEASWGTWRTRLALLLDGGLLTLDLEGPDPASAAPDPKFEVFAQEIARERQGGRSLATALDAAALTHLARVCEDVREGSTTELPRFFTSSINLQTLFRKNRHWQDEFRYYYEDRGERRRGYAWRDSHYYYMRSVYPALRIGNNRRIASTEEPTIGTLRTLHEDLIAALEYGSAQTLELVTEYQLPGDRTLAQQIEGFDSHQMAEIWLQYGGHEELPDRLSGLPRLAQFGAAPVTQKVAGEIEVAYLRHLGHELSDRALSLQIIDRVSQASSEFEHANFSEPLSLNEDLGSIRWGLEYATADDLVTLQPRLGRDSDSDAEMGDKGGRGHRELLQLYSVSYLASNNASAERAIAVLIGLEAFDLAHRLLDRIETADSEAIFLMRMVATIGKRGHRTESQLQHASGIVRSRWNSLSKAEQQRYSIGYGYLGYTIWSFMAQGGAWRGSAPRGDESELLAWSQSVVQRSLDERLRDSDSSMSDLWIAYAVNHLVYVATMSDSITDKIEDMASDFELVAKKLDNYRFLDTVGCYLASQSRKLAGIGGDQIAHQQALSLLERALTHLDRAVQLARSDLEVRQHRDAARSRLLKLRQN